MSEREKLKVGIQPLKLRIESEPYASFLGRRYSVMLDVWDIKRKREYYLIIDAQSLSQPIHKLTVTEGTLKDLEVWILKESEEKYAKYEVTLA